MEINYQAVVFFESGVCAFSILMKIIQNILFRKLMRESSDAGNATGKIVCNIKKQFDVEYSKNNKINNVNAFVFKKMYEMKMLGLKMITWEIFGIVSIFLCVVPGVGAAVFSYINQYDEQVVLMHVLTGFVMGFLIIICDLISNIQNKMNYLHVNLCDYFENTYIPFLEKGDDIKDSLPYEAKGIDEGIQELFRLMSEDCEEAKVLAEKIDADKVAETIDINENEEKILHEVFEEYLI